MERICEKCGSLVSGDVKFCPMCGEFLKSAIDLGKGDAMPPVQPNYGVQTNYGVQQNYGMQQPGYGVPQYTNTPIQTTGQYNNNATAQNNSAQPVENMTLGQWVGTICICSLFGLVSLILNIVWGFGSNTPEPKRTFCRAMMIINIVGYAIGIIMSFFMIAIVGGLSEYLLY